MAKIEVGKLATDQPFVDINNIKHWVGRRNIQLANVGQKTLLSFYREASCAFCNHRIYLVSQQAKKLAQKNLRIISVFVSEKHEIEQIFSRQSKSMIMVSDPDKVHYDSFGLQQASAADKTKAIIGRVFPLIQGNLLLARTGAKIQKDSRIVPADFLINPDGFIEHAHYGRDIGDHIAMDKILKFAGL